MPLGIPGRRLPLPEEVGDFLAGLLGQAVTASTRRDVEFSDDAQLVTGRYHDDRSRLLCACVADLPLAASAAGALAMMPRGSVDEAVEAGQLGASLEENFHEVANIMSKFLNGPSVPHVRLVDVVDGLPDDAAGLVGAAVRRRDYDVTIVGYPGGRLTLLAS
jgi:hypothetical protein